jgi:hypothetical protein
MHIYLCLSYCGCIRLNKSDAEKELGKIATHIKAIERIAEVNPANYTAWLLLLHAEIADVKGNQFDGLSAPFDEVSNALQPLRRMSRLWTTHRVKAMIWTRPWSWSCTRSR